MKKPHLFRGLIAGAAGGLVASWTMNAFLTGSCKAQEAVKDPEEKAHDQAQQAKAGDDSTQKVADTLTREVADHPLTQEEKKTAGPVVHYVFGGVMGGVYGALAEYLPASRLGMGTVFGSALFLGADELAVPAFGLSKPPTEEPIGGQVNHWAAHLVYGATVELVRRQLRRVL